MYKTLDLTKFILSFLVIAIHAALISSKTSYFLLNHVWHLAVPIFFLISGFFIFKNYKKEGIKKIDLYIKKLIKLYILYTIIYLPLTLIGCFENNTPFLMDILIFIQKVLFVGENYYSWPLWYLLALIISTIITRTLLYFKIRIINIFFLGLFLTLTGICVNYFIHTPTNTFIDNIIFIYKKIFITTRNGFFVGFGYVSTGLLLACYEEYLSKYLNKNLKWLYILFIISYITYYNNIPLSLNILSTIVFILLLLNNNIYNGINNIWLRNMSTIIYFFHMYFVYIVVVFIDLTNVQVSFIYSFIFISISTTAFSALVLKLSESKQFLFLKKLLG